MTAPCQCCYETASLQVAEGELRGVLVCAVCSRPKARAVLDTLLPYEHAATALGLPESILRTLVSAGSIVPTVRRGNFVRLLPSHIRAQLAQKGIHK